MWPHFDSVGKKAEKLYEDYKTGKDIVTYQTTGTEDKRAPEPKRATIKNTSVSPSKTMGGTNISQNAA